MPRILLIDHGHPGTRLAARLAGEGFGVVVVSSETQLPHAAVAPDLILLNMQLPHGGGLTAFQTLRSQEDTRRLPIVLMREDVGADYWAPLPEAGDGPAVVSGRQPDDGLLVARVGQWLACPGDEHQWSGARPRTNW